MGRPASACKNYGLLAPVMYHPGPYGLPCSGTMSSLAIFWRQGYKSHHQKHHDIMLVKHSMRIQIHSEVTNVMLYCP